MTRDFNIIATTDKINESRAMSELWILLRAAGDDNPLTFRIGIWGLIAAKTSLEPLSGIENLIEYVKIKSDSIFALYRVIPIQRVVSSEISEISKTVSELSAVIRDGETFRITVEKRRTNLSSSEIIEFVANLIDRKVNLKDPNWIVLVEIVGKVTGISVIKPSQILNVQKIKAGLATQAKKGALLDD